LILEPSRANLTLYSEQFDNAYWTTLNCTIAANDIISPDGTQDADKLTSTSTISEVYARATYATILAGIGDTYTTSIYVKKGTANFLRIRNLFVQNGTALGNAWFNLNTGAVGTVQSSQTATMTSVGNGWYRCTLTGVVGSTLNFGFVDFGLSDAETSIPTTSVNGYLWGASLELGTSATSYIPTTTASVTRLAESSSSASIPSLFGTTEGSFFIECTFDGRNTNGAIPLFLRSSVSTSFNQATYLQFGSTTITLNVYSGTTLQAAISGGSFTTGQTLKIAFGYKANDFVLYVNGVQIGTDTSGAISTSLSFIDLGSYLALQSTFQYDGKISQALLFKTRLSNSSLAELTTI
jgi:hypothetical protein